MTANPVKRVGKALRYFEFDDASGLGSFLLTCLEDTNYAHGSPIFEEHLNRIYIRAKPPRRLHVRVAAEPELLAPLMQMAAANGAKIHKGEAMTDTYSAPVDILKFVQMLRLQPAAATGLSPERLLLGLWNCDEKLLRDALLYLTELSSVRCEVTFLARQGVDCPSHLIMLQGISHPDAILNWVQGRRLQIEVFQPNSPGTARFFVQRGFRFPMPGLEKLWDLPSELVLLRNQEQKRAQWLAFTHNELHFFRKMHEFSSVTMDVEPLPLVEMALPEEDQRSVPVELALAGDSLEGGPKRVWQLDKLIDLQRQKLNELEKRRQQMASDSSSDVYLAYKFFQRGALRLNPLLVRFLQQRLAVLADYEYAFCQPEAGDPYHMVIAQRTQRHMGFGLQLADVTFYQPEEYRRWGVNLYLPMGKRLVPSLDSGDAIPLLQQLLEKAGIQDTQAVLWEFRADNRIAETRLQETQPLLTQFRVLNSFQREQAMQVAQKTRQAISDELRAARGKLSITCRDIEQNILEYLGARCEEIEATYGHLHKRIADGQADLAKQETQIQEVAAFVDNLPKVWADFVQDVIGKNRSFAQSRLDAMKAMQQEYLHDRQDLRALAACHRDLAWQVQGWPQRLAQDESSLAQDIAAVEESLRKGLEINTKLYAVCVQIRDAYAKLAQRLEAIAAARKKADKIQAAIDNVDAQEREVKARLQRLEGMVEQIRQRREKVQKDFTDLQAREVDVASKAAEVAKGEEDARLRLHETSERLARLGQDLQRVAAEAQGTEDLFKAMDKEVEWLERRASIVERWRQHATKWSQYLQTQHQQLSHVGAPTSTPGST